MKISKSIKADSVQLSFPHGGVVDVSLSALPSTIVTRLALHGLSLKLGAIASSSASEEEAFQRAKELANRLACGQWSLRDREPTYSWFEKAVANYWNLPLAEARNNLKAMPKWEVQEMRSSPVIQASILCLKADALMEEELKATDVQE